MLGVGMAHKNREAKDETRRPVDQRREAIKP